MCRCNVGATGCKMAGISTAKEHEVGMTRQRRILCGASGVLLAVSFGTAAAMADPGVQAGDVSDASEIDEERRQTLDELINDPALSGRVLWYDLLANVQYLNTPEKVEHIVGRTAQAGFDTIVLDVQNNSGFVAYDSDIAPHMSEAEYYENNSYDADYDLLAEVLAAAERHDIEVHANINTFSQGILQSQEGPAFDNPEWQTVYYEGQRMAQAGSETYPIAGFNIERGAGQLVVYTPDRYDVSPANRWGTEVAVVDGVVTDYRDRNTHDSPPMEVPEDGVVLSGNAAARQWLDANARVGAEIAWDQTETRFVRAGDSDRTGATFVNPLNEDVRAYVHSVVEELVTNYDLDGIVFDRARYSNQFADFSDASRAAFEERIGHEVENWPEDIFEIQFTETDQTIERGPLFPEWIEFRAAVITDAVADMSEYVRSLDPMVQVSIYAGARYELDGQEGVNWGSENYQPPYDWASPDYGSTGYAEHLDFFMAGTYFEDVTKAEAIASGQPADWYSVEGSAEMAMEAVDLANITYASLYLNQYQGDPDQFKRAMEMAIEKTHGIMIFDLVYLEEFEWWDIAQEVLDTGATSPHREGDLVNLIRGDAPNDANIVLNEIRPQGQSWIELRNEGAGTVGLEGWTLRGERGSFTFSDTALEPGEILLLEQPVLQVKLTGNDEVRLVDSRGAEIDAYSWRGAPGPGSFSRCDGDMESVRTATPDAENVCD